jgi:CelD/BcsL family acetyltransferase involved in cellulose biosynthesis
VEYAEFGTDSNAAEWIEEFLALEASGWKGQEGSAMASREVHRKFFESLAGEAIRQGRCVMSALRLDGKMIAARTVLRAGGACFLFKMAYDEKYARFSPGLLLEIEALRGSAAGEYTDCCTAPDNTMFKRIWSDLRTIQEVVVAPGRRSGELALSVLPLLRWVNRVLLPGRAGGGRDGETDA